MGSELLDLIISSINVHVSLKNTWGFVILASSVKKPRVVVTGIVLYPTWARTWKFALFLTVSCFRNPTEFALITRLRFASVHIHSLTIFVRLVKLHFDSLSWLYDSRPVLDPSRVLILAARPTRLVSMRDHRFGHTNGLILVDFVWMPAAEHFNSPM